MDLEYRASQMRCWRSVAWKMTWMTAGCCSISSGDSCGEIKMATLLTLSHMLHEEDYHLLTIDEEFMVYFLDLIKKAIANGSHFVAICSNVPHLTEIREMFDAFSKVYRLQKNQQVIDRMKKEDLALQILHVLRKSDLDEKLFALQMLTSMCTFQMGKTIFQNQYYDDVLHEVGILSKCDDLHVRHQAEIVYEFLKPKGEGNSSSRKGTEMKELYLQALSEGSTLDRTVRVMFVGHKGAGKTTLCRRFLGENITSIRSTEGIDVYIEKFIVNLETRKWTIDVEGDPLENSRSKIAMGVKQFEDLKALESETDGEPECSPLSNTGDENQVIEAGAVADFISENFEEKDKDTTKKYTVLYERRNEASDNETERGNKIENIDMNMKINFEIEANLNLPTETAYVSMWDFAGEDVFYATHHVFLSPDAVYLIVIDLSNSETNNVTEIEKARFWLRSILTYAKVKDKDGSCGFRLPPIIFVVTHKDKIPGQNEEEKREVAHSYLADILNLPELIGIDLSFIRGRFVIDNTYLHYDPELEKLKDCIVESARIQPNWEKDIPLQWLAVEREISNFKSQNVKVLEIEELRKHLETCEVNTSTLQNLTGVLEHFHLKGYIIFFSGSEKLKNYVFIDPQWIVNAFKQLITIPCGKRRFESETIRNQWALVNEEGKLTPDFAKEIFRLNGDKQLIIHEACVLNSLEELNLIATMSSVWIVPSLLKRQIYTSLVNDYFDGSSPSIEKSCAYCLKFREAFVPDPILDKVVAACLSNWSQVHHFQGKPILYRGLVCLKVTTDCNLMLYCKDNLIQAMLFRNHPTSHKSFGEVGDHVRLFLHDCIDEIFRTCHQESMKPIVYIQCQIMEPEDSMPVLADEIFQHDTGYCCRNRTLTPHPLTHDSLRHWWKRVEKFLPHVQDLEIFSTPPQSPDPDDVGFPSFPFLEEDKSVVHGENRFKRVVDSTLTAEVWENLYKCSQSVGCLHSPFQTSTVFRVGSRSVMSVAHHVLKIIDCSDSSSDYRQIEHSRLQDENIFIEFKGSSKEANRLFYVHEILYLDEVKDVCIMKLLDTDPSSLPPPFTEFGLPTVDSIVTLIGFGHPNHIYKTFEPKVRVLDWKSKRVEKSVEWVRSNYVQIKNILQFTGKPVEWVDIAYSILQSEGIVGLNCFMQHGASGAPGIAMTTRGLALVVMLQGGLPKFFNDIGHYAEQIPLEQRIEYGITMDIIRQDLLQHAPELCKDVFGSN
ncbi:uncharacterized protein LOC111119416 isoform X4 [Crassostrea virginica]